MVEISRAYLYILFYLRIAACVASTMEVNVQVYVDDSTGQREYARLLSFFFVGGGGVWFNAIIDLAHNIRRWSYCNQVRYSLRSRNFK